MVSVYYWRTTQNWDGPPNHQSWVVRWATQDFAFSAALPQTFVHTVTFEQLLGFLSFLAQHFWHKCWPWPIDYLIRFWSIFVVTLTLSFQGQIWNLLYLSQKWSDCHETKSKHISIELWASNVTIEFDLGHDLDLEFSRTNMEFAISQPKMVWLPQNEKQIYRLNSRPQMWPSGLTLAMTLTLDFSRWNMEFAISQPKMVRLPRNKKQTYRLNFRSQMWPSGLTLAMTLIFEFSRSNVT